MADIKWSAFPNGGAMVSGDQLVGLRGGANTQLTPVTSSQIQSFAFNAAGATGVNDAFVVTLSPAPAALTDGLLITMDSAGLENLTTTPTLKVNSFAAKPIVTFAGAPAPGDIQQNEEYIFVYSLTNDRFQLINPSTTTADTFQVQSSGYSYALDTGVANAYIANILPAQLTTQSGLQIVMTAVNANSGASTLTVNGVTRPILLSNGVALTGGEILVNGIYQLFYSAALTAFVLINSSQSASVLSTLTYTSNSAVFPEMFSITKGTFINANGTAQNQIILAPFTPTTDNFLTTINLGNTTILNGNFGNTYNNLTSFVGNSVTNITTAFTGVFTILTTFNMTSLKYVAVNFSGVFTVLTTFSLPALVSTGGNFNAQGPLLTSISVPLLQYVGATFGSLGASVTTVDYTSLATVAGMVTINYGALVTCNLNALVSVGGNFIPTLASATTFGLNSAATFGGTIAITAGSLVTFSLPAIVSVVSTFTITAANMVTFSLGATLKSIGGNFTMTGMKLDQASVDGILVSLAALDGTGGTTAYSSRTVNLSGGTSATPSATGLAAKAVLVARGCTVTNN